MTTDQNSAADDGIRSYQATWSKLAKAAAWAAAVVGAFLTAPAQYSMQSSSAPAVMFLQFMTAVLFGLAFSVGARSRERASSSRRLLYLAVSVGVLVVLFFAYFFLKPLWTCEYATRFLLVIGSELASDASQYVARNPGFSPTCSELLAEYAGDNLAIWGKTSILVRHIALTVIFSLAWLSSVATLILTIEHVGAARHNLRRRSQDR